MTGKDDVQTSGNPKNLPTHPGARPSKGVAEKFLKTVEMRFADQGLLIVCQGGFHPDVQELKLWDLSTLPTFPPDHPQYLRVWEMRMKYERENERIQAQCKNIMLRAWTSITNQIMTSCEETHPALYNDLFEDCRLDKRADGTYVPGGYSDGRRAYLMLLQSLSTDERTKDDGGPPLGARIGKNDCFF